MESRICQGALALTLLSSVAGCGGEATLEDVRDGKATVKGEGVLLIVVDGLRADHTTLGGYDRDTTPFLHRFAQNAMVFDDAWSPTASLLGSHVSILSGSDPSLAQPPLPFAGAGGEESTDSDSGDNRAELMDAAWFVPEGLWLLGMSFLAHGWNTAAFVDHPLIAELRGFSGGFASFAQYGGEPDDSDRTVGVFGVGKRFVRWANERPLDESWFAYLHLNDMERVWTEASSLKHTRGIDQRTADWVPRDELDFVPPLGWTEPLLGALPPSRASRDRSVTMAEYELRYDRGLRALDTNLARIIGHAEEFGRQDHLTVVIAGSFGMGLGENGFFLHACLVEEADLRVPLMIRPSKRLREELGWDPQPADPKLGRPLRRSDRLVSLLDIAPTLVELLSLENAEPDAGERPSGRGAGSTPVPMHGFSLVPLLRGGPASLPSGGEFARRQIFALSTMPPGGAVISEGAKYSMYRLGEATPSIKQTWSSAAPDGVTEMSAWRDQGDAGLPGAVGDKMRADLESWRAELFRERRFLHFGEDQADRPPIGIFRDLQADSPPH